MAQNEPAAREEKGRHFLFHIFRIDKEENPMPLPQANALLQFLRTVFTDNTNNEK